MLEKTIRLGIGFATGRKSFRKVLNSYIYSWKEYQASSGTKEKISLNLFVAYDVDYSNTKSTDYTNLSQDMVDIFDEVVFLGANNTYKSILNHVSAGNLSKAEAKLLFGTGYAGKRNSILYTAIEYHMDYLLFLDDDEYPVAVTNSKGNCLWSGQYVLPMHLESIKDADITIGCHCGYISPIPQIEYTKALTETDFSHFIGAISNDIVNWDSIKQIMENGGVTYADVSVLVSKETVPVEEINHCKFISGSNLCINLRNPHRTFPFFNPPGARGEDTFLSTLLSDRKVVSIPCYTFHDGFSAYKHLLDGVLPIRLAPIAAESNNSIVKRFYSACVGWVRYKPLLLYIQNPDAYESVISELQKTLDDTIPKICEYFGSNDFLKVPLEFQKYSKNVKKHAVQFENTQLAWTKLLAVHKK